MRVAHGAGKDEAGADKLSFKEWASPSVPTVARFIARVAPELETQDVLQDVLLRAWIVRDRFDEDRGTTTSWLATIAVDQIRQNRRRKRRQPVTVSGLDLTTHESLGSAVDDNITFALNTLPARQRLAVEGFYFVGLTLIEIAQILNCRPGSARNLLMRARKNLRPHLEERT